MRLPLKLLGTLILAATAVSAPLGAQAPKVQYHAASPAATLKQRIGLTDIEINYSRPGAKGRTMLGGINPFGTVWRTGANAATTLTVSTAVRMNGAAVPAGTYALFTIPGGTEWTVIICKNAKQWGAFNYDPKDDLVRFKATPVTLAEHVETFTIEFGDIRDDSATLNLEWEHTRVPIKLEFDIVPKILGQIQDALAAPGPKSANFYYAAANFYFDHGQDLGKCLELVNAMIALHPRGEYEGLYLKARILAKQGDHEGAVAAAKASREGAIKAAGPEDSIVKLDDALIASH